MTPQEYNRICKVYQFLTKRLDPSQNYHIDGFYRVYDSQHYGVRDEAFEGVRYFENLTLNYVFTKEYLAGQHFSKNYYFSNGFSNSPMVVIKNDNISVHPELGFVFLYILIFKFQNGIIAFLDLLYQLNDKKTTLIRISEDGKTVKIKAYGYDDFVSVFEVIPNINLIFDFFLFTNSNFMIKNWNNEIEIQVIKIRNALDTLKIFNFDNMNMNF